MAANLYTTPDTLPKGTAQVAIAAEAWNLDEVMGPTQDGTFPSRRYTERGLSAVPTVLVRAGVGDRVDVGVGLSRTTNREARISPSSPRSGSS